MVVSVTLGFMLHALIKKSEGFQKRPNNMVNILFEKGEGCVHL